MRRQIQSPGLGIEWDARPLEVRPSHKPLRYRVPLKGILGRRFGGADHILIGSHGVAIQRRVLGFKFRTVKLPFEAFEGVAIRAVPSNNSKPGPSNRPIFGLTLQHSEPRYRLPLYMADHDRDITALWQSWGKHFCLPLLVIDFDGTPLAIQNRLGKLQIGYAIPRASRRLLIRRRPMMGMFRAVGLPWADKIIAGTEMIARH